MLKSAAYLAGCADTYARLGLRKIAGMTPLRAKVIRQGTERLHLQALDGGAEGAAANARRNRSRFQAEAGAQGSFGPAGRVEGQPAINPKQVHARRQQLDAINAGAGDALTMFPKGSTLTPDEYTQARTRMDAYTKDVPAKRPAAKPAAKPAAQPAAQPAAAVHARPAVPAVRAGRVSPAGAAVVSGPAGGAVDRPVSFNFKEIDTY